MRPPITGSDRNGAEQEPGEVDDDTNRCGSTSLGRRQRLGPQHRRQASPPRRTSSGPTERDGARGDTRRPAVDAGDHRDRAPMARRRTAQRRYRHAVEGLEPSIDQVHTQVRDVSKDAAGGGGGSGRREFDVTAARRRRPPAAVDDVGRLSQMPRQNGR